LSRRAGARPVTEVESAGAPPRLVHPEWAERWPWLRQGITWAGPDRGFDLGLSGSAPVGEVLDRWRRLRECLGFDAAVHARQVHGARVLRHDRAPPGFLLGGEADGHVARGPGLLLTISVADCVPVFVVDPQMRAIALLHAGWRGTAAGMMEQGIRTLTEATGTPPSALHVHFGPAICGACYEVGPEVHAALGLHDPAGPAPVDLRAILSDRAVAAGVATAALTCSVACTRCEAGRFFSHRAGSPGRQAAWLGRST
jgi:YfiH family protein